MSDAAPDQTGDKSYSGKVIWYDRMQGYGFLLLDGYPKDMLVHNTEVRRANLPRHYLLKGDLVRCKVGEFRGKPCAVEIELTQSAE